MITEAVIGATGTLLLGAIVTIIARSERADTDTEPTPEVAADQDAAFFEALRAEPFTDTADAVTPATRRAAGRHRPGAVEPAPADYLIPNAYAARLALEAEQAVSE